MRTAIVFVLGTIFAVAAGFTAIVVVLHVFELLHARADPLIFFLVTLFGVVICSIYTSLGTRVELDLRVVFLSSFLGLLLFLPLGITDTGDALVLLVATSLINSFLSKLTTEEFGVVDAEFLNRVHGLQWVIMMLAIAFSFGDMSIRVALFALGLIAYTSWQPAFLGGCVLTLLEAKLDVEGKRPEMVERGFILHYLEKWLGARPSLAKCNMFVRGSVGLLCSYWIIDFFV